MKTYKDIEYLVWRNPSMLYFCAYVKLPNDHKWVEILKKKKSFKGLAYKVCDYEKVPVVCHGGLTFGEYCKANDFRLNKGYWIGWDYAHAGDYIPSIYKKHNKKLKVWTKEQVEKEVIGVIKQILKTYGK